MLFTDQPEFITNDPRNDPNHDVGWTPELQWDRYAAWLETVDLAGKTVLDLGCAAAAVGAFCLHRGAAHYQGVEISEQIASMAQQNLTRYYDSNRWSITVDAAESVISQDAASWDVIIAAGVMHGVTDILGFMRHISSRADTIVIENFHPMSVLVPSLINRLYALAPTEEERAVIMRAVLYLEHEHPYIEINPHGKMCLDDHSASANNIMKLGASMGAVKVIMHKLGFTADYAPYSKLRQQHKRYFGNGCRYVVLLKRTHAAIPMSFTDLRRSGMLTATDWATMGPKGGI